MIYYFTGTGNSRYAAEKLALLTGDKCVSIASIFNGTVKPVEGRKDTTGFVFPVYYGGMPEMVKRFASHPEIKKHLAPYVFCVITCGADSFACDTKLSEALERRVDYSQNVVMPDNYVMLYNPSTGDEAKEKLRNADARLEQIAGEIAAHYRCVNTNFKSKAMTGIMYPLYNVFRTTLLFDVDEKCDSCGFCAKICPEGAIELKRGVPEWTKKKCQHCTACINRCPKHAIQFGLMTKNRDRYNIMSIR